MNRGVVLVVVHAQLRGVAREQKVLAVRIGNDDLLIAQRHGIQATVGVLLQEIEIGDVVLPPIRIQVAAQTHAGLLFYEQDEHPGVRLYGNLDSNRWQYNVAEQTHAGLLFYEQEAAKIAIES